jgi:hypothetical protein
MLCGEFAGCRVADRSQAVIPLPMRTSAGSLATAEPKNDTVRMNAQKNPWVLEHDTVDLMAGASSVDVRVQKTIRVNNAGI